MLSKKDSGKHFFDSNLKGIDIYSFHNSKNNYSKHFHEEQYMLALVFNGSAYTLETNITDSSVGPNCISLMNPSIVHSGIVDQNKGLTYISVHINKSYFRSEYIGQLNLKNPEFTKLTIKNSIFTKALITLSSVFMIKHISTLEREQALLNLLEVALMNTNTYIKKNSNKDDSKIIKHAKEILSEDLSKDISINLLAKELNLSRGYFFRYFSKKVGISPAMYRNILRIEKAKSLFLTKNNQKNSFYDLGFADYSHFYRVFKKVTAITPRNY